ncbi:coagulation factor X-like [Sitodiplosis mosellana]|uniref:coagulation factor X-like n=1 Tax=Sitodiplosis mosellana TaxID=263140 RepID=UPI002443F84A|nr:coagulation factor X-like [Sitodiplosis mosellana]
MGINGTEGGRGSFLPITLFLDFIHDPKSVKLIPPPLTPNEAKFLADITVPGKFLTGYKDDYADSDEGVQLLFNAIILSKTEILTCAHSVLGAPYVYVIVNKLSRNATRLKVTEDQIEIHEKYTFSGFAFNIAKITLEEPLEFNDNVGSIDLVDKDYKMNDPSEMVTVYGNMVLDGIKRTRRYDTKYLDGAKCKPKVNRVFDAKHLMCYTSDESMGALSTFGGPMISKKNNKLVGMTINRLPDQLVIFQPIAPLLDWIRKPRVKRNQRKRISAGKKEV